MTSPIRVADALAVPAIEHRWHSDPWHIDDPDDGALIEVQSDGMRHGPADVMARLARGDTVGAHEYFFRTLIRFTTGASQWLHLNKVMALAVGQRQAGLVLLDVYRIT